MDTYDAITTEIKGFFVNNQRVKRVAPGTYLLVDCVKIAKHVTLFLLQIFPQESCNNC